MKKILITGKNGQVGWELQKTLAPLGHIWCYDRNELDLMQPEAIAKAVRDIKPDIIVNAAAYTQVDKAESEPEEAFAVNAKAPLIFAEEAKKCGAIFVHYSTDYVFEGASSKPYDENDITNPLNVYGKTKLQGELAIQAIGGKYLILRTSWVYGMRGANFLMTMLRLGKERDRLKIVSDQVGAPTWCHLIAQMTEQMLSRAFILQDQKELWGIYHLTSGGQTSWFGFAEEIFNFYKNSYLNRQNGGKIPQLEEIMTSEYPTPATRPLYSVLSNEKLKNNFRLSMPHWKIGFGLCTSLQHETFK